MTLVLGVFIYHGFPELIITAYLYESSSPSIKGHEMDSQALAYAKYLIDSFDLSKVVNRLIQVDEWSKKEALAACRYYRNYLYLLLKYDEIEMPPSKEIDEVWHAHILHTEDYQQFCQNIFGYFLHHVPNHDENKQQALTITEDLFESQTQRLYYQEFGDYIYAIKPLSVKVYFKRFLRELKSMFLYKETSTVKESIMDTSH